MPITNGPLPIFRERKRKDNQSHDSKRRKKQMAKAKADTDLCKGCRLCVGVCPVKAIKPLTEVNKRAMRSLELMKKLASGADSAM
jgi:2-oxoglutarate ferredoxin oxidoreductase subunit delta